MPHLLVLSYVAATMIGLTALAISVVAAIRSRDRGYWLLILFYAAFTGQIAALFTREYLYVNVPGFSPGTIIMTYGAGIVLSMLSMAVITLYYHRVFAVRFQKLRDAAVLAVALCGAIACLWPNGITVDAAAGLFVRNTPVLAGSCAYLVVFAYLLVVGAAGSKSDRPPRELLLIWSTYLFGLIGFGESLVGLVQELRDPRVLMSASGQPFMISTIPYALFGGVLAYYFGSFLVADARPARGVADEFAGRFQISPREREVIQLLNQGLGNREIAHRLFVSVATVKTHVHNIYEKTGAKSRYELYRLVEPAEHKAI